MMNMVKNIILVFSASRAKAEAGGEIVKLFAGHMSRRESRLTRGIGFQDSCDVFLLAMMPNCWEFKADL